MIKFSMPIRFRYAPAREHSGPHEEAAAAARYHAARVTFLTSMIGRASHDLRGVLSPALLAAERLEGSTEPATRRASQIVTRAVDRATALIQDTLDKAREGGKAVRVRALLRDLITDPLVTHETDVSIGEIDPVQLAEAFAALVQDARARGATAIRVAWEPSGPIRLIDNGEAPPDQPFTPVPGTGPRSYTRATARELIRAQGGEITLDAAASGAITASIVLAHARRMQPPAPHTSGGVSSSTV